ncbi:MAG TPA: hypothetical protein VF005_04090 [Acidimicrobiales bacterium]
MRSRAVVAVVVAVAVIAAGCSGGGQSSSPPPSPQTNAVPVATNGGAPIAAALTTAPTVALDIQVVVGDPTAPVTTNTSGSPVALEAQVKGDRAPAGPSPANVGTSVGGLSILRRGATSPGVSRVGVLAYLKGVSLSGGLSYNWQLRAAPGGSQASLQGPDTPAATLGVDLPGTYDVALTLGDRPAANPGGSTSKQPVVVTTRPDDPPMGVPIDTVASDSGQISVNGKVLDKTGNATGLNYAVLERGSRTVLESNNTTADATGVTTLINLANKYSKDTAYLMVVNSPGKRAAGPDLAGLFTKLGVGPRSSQDDNFSKNGGPFSVLGIPGAPAGAAWASFGSGPPRSSFELRGNLQFNGVTNQYDFVSPERPSFDTQAPGSGGLTNKITVDTAPLLLPPPQPPNTTYTATLPSGGSADAAGFQVVALDPKTLTLLPLPDNNKAWPTNGYGTTDPQKQTELATGIGKLKAAMPSPLIIVQSIGKPKPAGPQWAQITALLQVLGANPAVFNGLTGAGGYTLVGRDERAPGAATTTLPAAESSSSIGQPGHLTGILARNRAFGFGPQLYDSPDQFGNLNTDLVSIAYQAPKPFTPFAGADVFADDYLGRHAGFCKPTDPGICDVRQAYYKNYTANWTQKYNQIRDAPYPSPADPRFSSDDLNNVKKVLLPEVNDVANLTDYLAKLEKPFTDTKADTYVDVKDVGRTVLDAVNPQDRKTNTNGLQFAQVFVSFAKVFADIADAKEVKIFIDSISAALGFAAAISRPDGTPTLPDVITAATDALATDVVGRLNAARDALVDLGLLMVSDAGKLRLAGSKVNTDWNLHPQYETKVGDSLRAGAKAWFYQTLLPIAYPAKLLQLTGGAPKAQDFQCWHWMRASPSVWKPVYTKPLPGQADSAQDLQMVDFKPGGAPIKSVAALSGGRKTKSYDFNPGPPANLMDPLFAPAGPGKTGLGLNKTQFFSPQKWPTRTQLTFTPPPERHPGGTEWCGLPAS